MSTVMQRHTAPRVSPPRKQPSGDQLRRDRWTAVIVVAVMAVLIGLIIWLASLGGGGAPYDGMDYFQMMP